MQANPSPALIGVTTCLLPTDPSRTIYNGRELIFIEHSMTRWLASSGHPVVSLPFDPHATPEENSALATRQAMVLDALVLHGGADVSPQTYGQTPRKPAWAGQPARDAYELALIRACLEREVPILGVCRGHQLLNVALGGTLYQDISEDNDGALTHRDAIAYEQNYHRAHLTPGGLLAKTYGSLEHTINSVHHQGVDRLGEGLVVEARSAQDDIIEAFRLDASDQFALGVQWHPEFQSPQDTKKLLDPAPILGLLVDAAKQRKQRTG